VVEHRDLFIPTLLRNSTPCVVIFQSSQIPGIASGRVNSAKSPHCLFTFLYLFLFLLLYYVYDFIVITAQARDRQTDGQTDRRKLDLNIAMPMIYVALSYSGTIGIGGLSVCLSVTVS